MKLTIKQIKQIIKEELRGIMETSDDLLNAFIEEMKQKNHFTRVHELDSWKPLYLQIMKTIIGPNLENEVIKYFVDAMTHNRTPDWDKDYTAELTMFVAFLREADEDWIFARDYFDQKSAEAFSTLFWKASRASSKLIEIGTAVQISHDGILRQYIEYDKTMVKLLAIYEYQMQNPIEGLNQWMVSEDPTLVIQAVNLLDDIIE